jgi:hypothetical protein
MRRWAPDLPLRRPEDLELPVSARLLHESNHLHWGAGALETPIGLCHFESLKVCLLQGLLVDTGPRDEPESTDGTY